ncbi:hypothetical protein [Salinicoccus roseus]|uniref:hypothetical protein n=1 Tax=Salinicoccus roseus TaxID=45670 RepID=UPI0023012889|nr:hypothetical protein [Salinicoccus roseus]
MNRLNHNDQIYLSELLTQCKFSTRAIFYLETALNEDFDKYDIDEVWYHVQMFLVSVGNVSKMLYSNPSKKSLKKYVDHHSEIARSHNLPELDFKNELLLRNYYEHYDEKLVDWLEGTPPNVAKMLNNIGPIDSFIGGMSFSYLKHLDTSSKILHLLDRSINLSDTYNKLVILEEHIEKILSE